MQAILTRAQSRAVDQRAIDSAHVPGVLLMENAGRGAVEVIRRDYPSAQRLVVVCGGGNNGGDGLVVARRWLTLGGQASVWLSTRPEQLTGDAAIQLRAFLGIGGMVESVEGGAFQEALSRADVVVDALFGTGLNRPLSDRAAALVQLINGCKAPKVALDLPSGLDADVGVQWGQCVRAAVTVTFGSPKRGLFTTFGYETAGRIRTVDIGVPRTLDGLEGQLAFAPDSTDVAAVLASRPRVTHKGRAGHVLVVAGSSGTLGAARLVALGAFRAGAGVVTIATHVDAARTLETTTTEVMVRGLSSGQQGVADLRSLLTRVSSVVVGPGLGDSDDSQAWLDCILRDCTGVVVADADALSMVSGDVERLRHARADLVLTPHPGEAARLLDSTAERVEADRFAALEALCQQTAATVVLKGAPSLIGDLQHVWVNASGHECLSTAGSGDVLSGIVAALGTQLSRSQAAWVGAWLHAEAGRAWAHARRTSSRGMLAREIADHLPEVVGGVLASPRRDVTDSG